MSKYATFFAIMRQAKAAGMNLTHQEVVSDFTNGRTDSLRDLLPQELKQLQENLSKLIRTESNKPGKTDPVADSMRKAVISQFLSIDRTQEDAIHWAETKGVYGKKKPFNDYSRKELYQLIRNAEKVKADHIKSVSKKLKTSAGNGL